MFNDIFNLLLKEYGEQGWWPYNFIYSKDFKIRERKEEEKFEIIIGAILTQNTAWINVEKAFKSLKEKNALSRERLTELSNEEIALLIKPSGYNNQKARKIKEFLKFDKEINRDNLLNLWGFGPETADSVLLYAFNKPVFVIDTYTKRIFSRVGLCSKDVKYEDLQKLFHDNLSKDYKLFNEYHALIVEHAKQHCKSKPECSGCCLDKICKKIIF